MKPKISLAEAQRLADSGMNGPAIARALGVSRKRIAYLIKIGALRCAVGTWGGWRWGKPKKDTETPVDKAVEGEKALSVNAEGGKLNGPQQVVEHPRGPDHRRPEQEIASMADQASIPIPGGFSTVNVSASSGGAP